MTYTSPEFLPITAECVVPVDVPDARHLEPCSESGEGIENTFDLQFSRCRELLYFIACRILNDPDQAEAAVKNCFFTALQNPTGFENEGDFRSWLLRILIDEASLLVNKNSSTQTSTETHSSGRLPSEEC